MKMKRIRNTIKSIRETIRISLSFATANFKLRNENSFFGILWYLLEPLLFLIILLFIRDATLNNNIEYYPVYLFIGLISYNFFMHATSMSTNIIQVKSKLIKNMNFKKEAIVISSTLQFILSHIFELIILIGLLFYFKIPFQNIFFYPITFLPILTFTLGLSFILSTIGVFISDLKNVWEVFCRILWFATPIFYSINGKGMIAKINDLNPLSKFLNMSRELIIYGRIDFKNWSILLTLSLIVFIIGILIFKKYKIKFAEKV